MPFREFIVYEHRFPPTGWQHTHIVRLTAKLDRYVATAYTQLADGGRKPLDLSWPTHAVSPDIFYGRRRLARRSVAMWATQALQAGEYEPAKDANAQTGIELRVNLAGWPEGYPGARLDDLQDWSEAVGEVPELEENPFRHFQYQPAAGEACTIELVSTGGGYTARAFRYLPLVDTLWGHRMPLVAHSPWRERVDAADFFRDRAAYRGRLVEKICRALDAGELVPIIAYRGRPSYEGFDDFDWVIQADLDPARWPQGYPEQVLDNLSDWRAPATR